MIDSVICFLIYGPVAVTLGCSLFFAIEAGRANKEVVVRVLSQNRVAFIGVAPADDCSLGRVSTCFKKYQSA